MIAIFWFRRDLRLEDNAALYYAFKSGCSVLPIFIFDTNILGKLEERSDARVTFLYDHLTSLQATIREQGGELVVRYGEPLVVWRQLLADYPKVRTVYANHDYEPYAQERDAAVRQLVVQNGVQWVSKKDHVIFEKSEVVKDDGTPYTVFTPYARRWLKKLESRTTTDANGQPILFYLKPYPSHSYAQNWHKPAALTPLPTLPAMGFERSQLAFPPSTLSSSVVKQYDEQRNFPAVRGTSRLGLHFRFGTISIRQKALKAKALSETFLNELIWRDFYAMILWNFPHVATAPFRPQYGLLAWRTDAADFERWCEGKTGYPIVDAGMRELNATGFMHNRVRMITASFLTKHLLLDYRWGEAYFAQKLLDFDLASNNGGWQWAAGCGTDAAPYFRIFNPTAQQEKFDKNLNYIRQWVPEFGTSRYPAPMVDHAFARERCLKTYKEALDGLKHG